MSGPVCEVLVDFVDESVLQTIDSVLAAIAEKIERTRKGCVWDVWIHGRPFDIHVDGAELAIFLHAGCNDREDYDILRQLSGELASKLNGLAKEPIK